MSMLLMVKAMNCTVGNSARKLVLLKLADNANDDGICFPSYQFIADKCEMSKRSAISHIDELIKMGYVSKKSRKNKDGSSSNLYQLHLDQGGENFSLGGANFAPGGENFALGGSENFAPITSHSSEPVNEPKKTTQKSAVDLLNDFGIDGQLADDFIAHRKAKRAVITETALAGFQREADKAGISIQQAVAISVERGWVGFKADWNWRDNPPNRNSGQIKPVIMDTKSVGWSKGMTLRIDGEDITL